MQFGTQSWYFWHMACCIWHATKSFLETLNSIVVWVLERRAYYCIKEERSVVQYWHVSQKGTPQYSMRALIYLWVWHRCACNLKVTSWNSQPVLPHLLPKYFQAEGWTPIHSEVTECYMLLRTMNTYSVSVNDCSTVLLEETWNVLTFFDNKYLSRQIQILLAPDTSDLYSQNVGAIAGC